MPDITWVDEFLPILLRPRFIPPHTRTVLDVGCGRGIAGCAVRVFREPANLVAIEVYRPYVDFVRKLGVYDSVLQLDVSDNKLPFENKQFDVVLCLEVIEHLEKSKGLDLLEELERVGRRVIVTTPLEFFKQPAYDGNVNQFHLSCYRVKEFEERGYQVYGVGGFRPLKRLAPRLSDAMSRFTLLFPRLSSSVMAVKDTDA